MYTKFQLHSLLCILIPAILLSSCKKLVEIDGPAEAITTKQVFASNKEAEWAVSGIYSKMANGLVPAYTANAAQTSFAAGLSTILGGLSSDELLAPATEPDYHFINNNQLSLFTSSQTAYIWNTTYKAIFDANAVIEGIAGSSSDALTDSVRKQLTGEALTLRAFSFFYLVNFFGDLPLPLTIDFNKTAMLTRSPVAKVYEQIIADLKKAIPLLQTGFNAGKSERVRINRWFAEGLLARASLFSGDYQGAITSATAVISQASLFGLEQDPANTFLKDSREAIFQLKPTNQDPTLGNALPEGYIMNPNSNGGNPKFSLRESMVNSFEANDKRKVAWIRHSGNGFHSWKYRIGNPNKVFMGAQSEYYVVMRLAELYLIRAEANILRSASNTTDAINDLNELRKRANASELPLNLSAQDVITAIARERQLELFAEWGHRWFDLKRTGKATEVLSVLPGKQPWKGDHQLLYPIPESEIRVNKNLVQNPGYVNL